MKKDWERLIEILAEVKEIAEFHNLPEDPSLLALDNLIDEVKTLEEIIYYESED